MKKQPGFVVGIILVVIAILLLAVGLIVYAGFSRSDGTKSTDGRSDTTGVASLDDETQNISGDKYQCAGVTNVPKEYMPWVEEAAKKYLGGDTNILLALVSVENNSWNAKAINSSSGASGLGQFVYRTAYGLTARNMPFNGYNIYDIRKVIGSPITSAVKKAFLSSPRFSRDGRLQPGPSLMASARKISVHMKQANGDLGWAYARYYHSWTNTSQEEVARRTASKLVNNYNTLKAKGCKAPAEKK